MSSSSRSAHGGDGDTPPVQKTFLSMVSSSGSHVFKIEGYSKTKDGLGGGSISSPVFTLGGHAWQIRYYPNLTCNLPVPGSWISMALVLVDTDAARVPVDASFRFMHHSGGSWIMASSHDKLVKVGGLTSYVCKYEGSSVTKHAVLTKKNGMEPGTKEPPEIVAQMRVEESTFLKDDCLRIMCDITLKDHPVGSTHFVTVPPSDMSRHFGGLLSAGKGVDVTFQVSGETFDAHRCVLAARSLVFMAELFGPMKENAATHVRINDMDPRVFKAMLHFIYTDSLLEMNDDDGEAPMEMTKHLLVAADRYNLERLKLLCEENLCNRVSTSTAATMLALSREHGCHGLKAACFKFLSSVANFQATILTDEFEHLQKCVPNILKELIANLAP